jgi:hypothetical protein
MVCDRAAAPVIASEAKQSSLFDDKDRIASSQALSQ